MIYFTAHTFKCMCHCRRAMFRVLGMYNFGVGIESRIPFKIFSTLTVHTGTLQFEEDNFSSLKAHPR